MPELKELVKQLGADQETAWKAYQKLLEMATRASGPDGDRMAAAAALAVELTARTPSQKDDKGRETGNKLVHSDEVRTKLCYLLSHVAGAAEVGAIASTLGDFDVREAARFALDRNTSEEATQALILAADEVGPIFRIGVISALAKRKGDHVLRTIKNATNDEDPAVRLAAVWALSRFADESCDAYIAEATRRGEKASRLQALRARVRLAETLHKAGHRDAAKRVYQAIQKSDAPAAQKKAAELALGSTA